MVELFETHRLMLLDMYHFNEIKKYRKSFEIISIMRNEKDKSKHYFFKNVLSANIIEGSDLDRLTSLYVSLAFEKY